ncbi:MAG: hypothetical protein ACLQPV_09385 [Vulcanimicrobiaceae bacterium]
MIFAFFYLAVLLLAYVELRVVPEPRRFPSVALPAWGAVAFLVAAYAAQIALEFWAATHVWGRPPSSVPLPIPVVTRGMAHPAVVGTLTIALAAAQSYALLALYRSRAKVAPVAAGFAAMLLLSLAAPALTNADAYAYVGNALLGAAAYAPPATAFPEAYRAINAFWHVPMTPTTYGPLWLVVVRAATSIAPTLAGKLFALRAYGAVLFVAMVAGLRVLGLPLRLIAVVALNPAMQLEFVANAHNDMTAIVLIVAAACCARALPLASAVLIVAAGMVKVPYVLLGLPVLAAVRDVRVRAAMALGAIASVAALSWATGGAPYLHALTSHVAGSPSQDAIHVVAALAALAALVVALMGGRRLRAAVWLMPALGAYVDSWYLMWGFPYALGRRRVLASFAIWFPLVAALVDLTIVQLWTAPLVASVVVGYLLLNRPRRAEAP